MRFGRTLGSFVPLVAAGAAVALGPACGRGVPAQPTDGGPTIDASQDVVRIPYDGAPSPEAGPRTAVHADFVSTRVDTASLMFAAGEMQTSGEPFMQNFAGRNLAYYDRYYIPVDQYLVPDHRRHAALAGVHGPLRLQQRGRVLRVLEVPREHARLRDGRRRLARQRAPAERPSGGHAARQVAHARASSCCSPRGPTCRATRTSTAARPWAATRSTTSASRASGRRWSRTGPSTPR